RFRLTRWAGPTHMERSGTTPRQAAVTFDDLPVISVSQIDVTARENLTRRLLDSIVAHKVLAIGFVNEFALYGYERESHGAPDANGSALLQMWLDAGLELGNHTFAHTDLHATS